MNPPRVLTALLATLLLASSARAGEISEAAPTPQAAAARSTAEAALQAGKLDEALMAATGLVELTPGWGWAFGFRAKVRLALAGPGSDVTSLGTPDLKRDYKPMVLNLTAAKLDLEQFFHLAPVVAEKDGALLLLVDTSSRLALAEKAVAAVDQRAKDDEAALRAQEAEKAQAAERAAAEKVRVEAEAKRLAEEAARQAAEQERLQAEQAHQRIVQAERAAYQRQVDHAAKLRAVGYALTTVAVGLAAGAIGLGVAANGDYNAVKTQSMETGAAVVTSKTNGDKDASITLGLAIGAGVLAAAGVPLIVLNRTPKAPQFSLAPTPNGVALALTGSLP